MEWVVCPLGFSGGNVIIWRMFRAHIVYPFPNIHFPKLVNSLIPSFTVYHGNAILSTSYNAGITSFTFLRIFPVASLQHLLFGRALNLLSCECMSKLFPTHLYVLITFIKHLQNLAVSLLSWLLPLCAD